MTNRCSTLLEQIALCVQSSDKTYVVIAAISCSDKSPDANANYHFSSVNILGSQQNFVAATCRTKSNFSRSHDEICCSNNSAIYHLVCSR